jgi:hypothetical protein
MAVESPLIRLKLDPHEGQSISVNDDSPRISIG